MTTMPEPNSPTPKSATSVLSPFGRLIADFSMRPEQFDQLLQHRGIRFKHFRATPCPNMKSLTANNHNPNCPHCDANGFLYYDEREIFGVFYSNSLDKIYEAQGVWETGSAVITFPNVYYEEVDGIWKQTDVLADFSPYDRLFVPDYTVRMWELATFKKKKTGPSVTGFRYPATAVDLVASVDSTNSLKKFVEGEDFNIDSQGRLEWVSGKEPESDDVLTISYYAHPVYNVVQLLHEQRVSQKMEDNGSKVTTRLPQNVLVKRDFLLNPPPKVES